MSQYKKVFITGAGGFIGKRLMQHYQAQGVEVCGLDFNADDSLNIISGDLCKTDEWKAILDGCDLVIHTAAVVSNVGEYDWFWDVNVKATADLLAAAEQAGVKRFIHLSSVAALGFDLAAKTDETTPLKPNGNPYVDTKIASEHAVLNAQNSGAMDVVIIRPGDVYGPASRPWVIVPLEMMGKKQFILPENGHGLFSPVYIDDLIDGIYSAGETEAAAGNIFILTSGETMSCQDYFGRLQTMLGITDGLKPMSTWLAILICDLVGGAYQLMKKPTEIGGDTMRMLARNGGYSNEKAQRILGFEPKFTIDEGMEQVQSWAKEEGLL